MQITRFARTLTLLGLLLAGASAPVAGARVAGAAPDESCFPQTGFCVRGRFLDYWQQHGGLAINGYPLTAERQERLEDGRTYTVQYFERVRLEYHPENALPQDVQLGQLGRRVHPADPPAKPDPAATYFPQTGHNLGDTVLLGTDHPTRFILEFRTYWEQHGGLAQFGYPISEVRYERLEDGQDHRVQYFERARFETGPVGVRLGQLGRLILAEVDAGR
jgi:hypothetical protein